MTPEQIAQIAHEVNRGYCASLGDVSQPAWADATEADRASKLAGVKMYAEKPESTPEQAHESWLATKAAEGWKYGETKNAKKKEHPCFKPYAELPAEQRAKDYIFRAAVLAALSIPAPEPVTVEVPVEKIVTVERTVTIGKTPIKYIGHRARYGDGAYGSGIWWNHGETVMVPDEFAAKQLRHPDVWVLGKAEEATDAPQAAKEATDDHAEVDQIRMEIATMDKDALESFAKTRYQIDIDKRHTVEALRQEVTGLIDRFGAV